ncbi:MAG: heparinase II/III family protein [Oscillospiraceae bacterium]|nr:heparinase II/III family protein [Oscillospiraceae bacterium]
MSLLKIATGLTQPLAVFQPYAAAENRPAWVRQVPAYLRQDLIQAAQPLLQYDFPLLKATDYMGFYNTGNRVDFELPYFTRRRVLNTLIMAECAEYQGRFLPDILNGLVALAEESGWQLPAHNRYSGGAFLPLPDPSHPVIDLFAAETAAQISMALYLLGEKLEILCPGLRIRLTRLLDQRILQPYLHDFFDWMGLPGEPSSNWNPWCTQNVLLTVFLRTDLAPAVKRRVLLQACRSLDYFMDSYGGDGCCNEGAAYYRHAALTLFNCLEVLNAVSQHAFATVWQEPKLKNMAAYIMNVHVSGALYANFADCAPTAGRAGCREFLFALRTGQSDMACFAADDYQQNPDHLGLETENLFYRVQAAFTERDIMNFAAGVPAAPADIYYPSNGLLISRDRQYFLAAKAGGNDDSHNHNDTGSLTVYKAGRPLLIDVGVGTYTRQTFSAERYQIWTMQSLYHNVFNFGARQQSAGAAYKAKATTVKLEAGTIWMSMDLTDCYPAGTIEAYVRMLTFHKNERIEICDTLLHPAERPQLTLMTLAKPHYDQARSVLMLELPYLGGSQIPAVSQSAAVSTPTVSARIYLPATCEVSVESIGLTDPKLAAVWGNAIYRTKVLTSGDSFGWSIE